MKYLRLFESMSDNTYIKVTEHNGWEGEDWVFFVLKNGNEEFLQKLKDANEKFPDLEDGDLYLEIDGEEIPESEVDSIMKHLGKKSGYMNFFNKVTAKLDPNSIDDSNEDNYTQCFNKGSLFP